MSTLRATLLVLAGAAAAHAQAGGPPDQGDGGPPGESYFDKHQQSFITAHAIIATITMGLLFPLGAIMIRLGSWPKTWLTHGLFQTASYCFYVVAVGLGIYVARNSQELDDKHPMIGLVVFALLSFEPILGYLHHRSYVKVGRRVSISHIHIWLGRIVITLGIINGGFGLQLSRATTGQYVGYSVAAAVVYLVYVGSAILGESRRRKASTTNAHPAKEQYT